MVEKMAVGLAERDKPLGVAAAARVQVAEPVSNERCVEPLVAWNRQVRTTCT